MDLAGVAFGGVDVAHLVAAGSVGTIDLLTDDGVLTEAQEHAAQGASQVEGEMGPIEGSDEMTGQVVLPMRIIKYLVSFAYRYVDLDD